MNSKSALRIEPWNWNRKPLALEQAQQRSCAKKIRSSTRSCKPRPILFSAGRRMARETTSAADFMNTPARRQVPLSDLAGWNICIRRTKSGVWLSGWDACSPAKRMSPNIASAASTSSTAGSALGLFPFAISTAASSSGMALVPTSMTVSCSNNRFATAHPELERMVDLRTTELRRLSSRLMTMQDEERRRIAREIHDGLGTGTGSRENDSRRNSRQGFLALNAGRRRRTPAS